MNRDAAAEDVSELRLAPESIEALATRIVELIREDGADEPIAEDDLISAAEVSRRYGVARRWVYDNREYLGAVELGTGARPRIRFDPRFLERRIGTPGGDRGGADVRRSTWIRASRISDSLSSRTRANVTRPREFTSGAAVGRPPDAAPDGGRTN